MLNGTEIRPVAAALTHADRRMEGHDRTNSHFSRPWESASKCIPEFYFFPCILWKTKCYNM